VKDSCCERGKEGQSISQGYTIAKPPRRSSLRKRKEGKGTGDDLLGGREERGRFTRVIFAVTQTSAMERAETFTKEEGLGQGKI